MTLYEQLVHAGCEIGNHESDLHVKYTPDSYRIVSEYRTESGRSLTITHFTSNIDRTAWMEIPFAFDSWWAAKAKAVQP